MYSTNGVFDVISDEILGIGTIVEDKGGCTTNSVSDVPSDDYFVDNVSFEVMEVYQVCVKDNITPCVIEKSVDKVVNIPDYASYKYITNQVSDFISGDILGINTVVEDIGVRT